MGLIIPLIDYEEAIQTLKIAKTQLCPDGNCCVICGDNDHQAWECRFNPLALAKRVIKEENTWRCFHCNQVFTDPIEAEKHFGKSHKAKRTPACHDELLKDLTEIAKKHNVIVITSTQKTE